MVAGSLEGFVFKREWFLKDLVSTNLRQKRVGERDEFDSVGQPVFLVVKLAKLPVEVVLEFTEQSVKN